MSRRGLFLLETGEHALDIVALLRPHGRGPSSMKLCTPMLARVDPRSVSTEIRSAVTVTIAVAGEVSSGTGKRP
ncbi:hypothetical protein ACH4A8_21910 [Streptomyces vietnamensis]|uniref:hypothetical protein n=1 Tax=Streptomyces vietnamensis TaxID=362257 RepID=UPI0037B5E675